MIAMIAMMMMVKMMMMTKVNYLRNNVREGAKEEPSKTKVKHYKNSKKLKL